VYQNPLFGGNQESVKFLSFAKNVIELVRPASEWVHFPHELEFLA